MLNGPDHALADADYRKEYGTKILQALHVMNTHLKTQRLECIKDILNTSLIGLISQQLETGHWTVLYKYNNQHDTLVLKNCVFDGTKISFNFVKIGTSTIVNQCVYVVYSDINFRLEYCDHGQLSALPLMYILDDSKTTSRIPQCCSLLKHFVYQKQIRPDNKVRYIGGSIDWVYTLDGTNIIRNDGQSTSPNAHAFPRYALGRFWPFQKKTEPISVNTNTYFFNALDIFGVHIINCKMPMETLPPRSGGTNPKPKAVAKPKAVSKADA